MICKCGFYRGLRVDFLEVRILLGLAEISFWV
jgi:hypothetical protein